MEKFKQLEKEYGFDSDTIKAGCIAHSYLEVMVNDVYIFKDTNYTNFISYNPNYMVLEDIKLSIKNNFGYTLTQASRVYAIDKFLYTKENRINMPLSNMIKLELINDSETMQEYKDNCHKLGI